MQVELEQTVPLPGYNIQSLFHVLPQHTVALTCAKALKLPQNGFLRGNQPWMATMVRTIYQQPSPDEVHAQLDRVDRSTRRPVPSGSLSTGRGWTRYPGLLQLPCRPLEEDLVQTTPWSVSTRRSGVAPMSCVKGGGILGHAVSMSSDYVRLSPNPPKDTDGRREESGRGVRELQGK